MSRKKTVEERIAEAERLDAEAVELARRQSECDHWRCQPTEFWWSTGKVRELTCDECGKTKFFEED